MTAPSLRSRLRHILLWQGPPAARSPLFLLALVLTLLFGLAHYWFGLAYAFHVFFILPVLPATGYIDARADTLIAVLAVAGGFCTDGLLDSPAADRLPLLFDSLARLSMFCGGLWLAAELRRVLERESRLAREDALPGSADGVSP